MYILNQGLIKSRYVNALEKRKAYLERRIELNGGRPDSVNGFEVQELHALKVFLSHVKKVEGVL